MKRTTIQTTKAILASAAIAGLLSGSFLAQAAEKGEKKGAKAGEAADAKKGETHECKGKNECKGKGGCKTDANACAGKNECKGKGGCGMKNGKPNPPKKKAA